MRFGISWVPSDLGPYGEVIRRSEEIGVELIGVPDSQSARYRECYVTLSHALNNSTSLRAGPLVTNPVTRHPAVTAAAIASADEMSGHRAFLCIGVGDSSVAGLGLPAAKLAELEEYVVALRRLLAGETATYHGHEISLGWVERPVPILIAGNGPKTLKLAGRLADGVLIGSGFAPETIALLRGHVAEGAAAAGRSLEDLELWYMARGAVAATHEEALDLVRPSLAGSAGHIFRSTMDGKGVPPELVDPLRELDRRLDLSFKSIPGAQNPNGQLIEELGLTEYLAGRLGIIGTEAEAIARFRELEALGINTIVLRPLVNDRHDFVDRLSRVIAEVRQPATPR